MAPFWTFQWLAPKRILDPAKKAEHIQANRELRSQRVERASQPLSEKARHDQLLAAVRTLWKNEKDPRLKEALHYALQQTEYERLREALREYKKLASREALPH